MPIIGLDGFVVVTGDISALVNRELRKLDDHLFLDFENIPPYGLVAIVKEHIGSHAAPLEVLRWQDDDGRPKPLSMAIVDELKRQASTRSLDAVKQAAKRNQARKDRLHAEARDAFDAIHDEHKGRVRAAELDSLPPGWRPKHFGKK